MTTWSNRPEILKGLVKRFKPPLTVRVRDDIGDGGTVSIIASVKIPEAAALCRVPIGQSVPSKFIADMLYDALSVQIARSLRLKRRGSRKESHRE